ncbi:MAG: GTP cyclohydrolase I, partial [Candidatus Binataceae bacterium]
MAQGRRSLTRALREVRTPESKPDRGEVEEAVRTIMRYIGEDPDRPGLKRTPLRVVKAFEYLTAGYQKDPKQEINGALFVEAEYQEM